MAAPGWAVRCEELGKQYRLGEGAGRPRSLYETLSDGLALLKGRSAPPREELFWALREVDFEIGQGEVVGVVGRNGAGKSTLLKILSRITTPTEGRVILRGKLASLLEVGTGFHPELTGRENIFLNGTILGMRRREIERKFDAIVAFAEVERFLDTPVKRYSSGMYVRLAFAVAAHLDADILLVDEVLSVGDRSFREKSLGRMNEVSRSGRTVIFVSHDLGAVRSLCRSIMVLEQGEKVFQGEVSEGLVLYEGNLVGRHASLEKVRFQGGLAGVLRFDSLVFRQEGLVVTSIDPLLDLEIVIQGYSERDFAALDLSTFVIREGHRLFTLNDGPSGQPMRRGEFRSSIRIPRATMRPGRYTFGLSAGQPSVGDWVWNPEVTAVEVVERWGLGCEERNVGSVNLNAQVSRCQ